MNRDLKLPSHRGVGGRFIEDFLSELKEYGMACGYSKRDFMVIVVPSALKGEAELLWTFKRGLQQWEQFRAAFSKRFHPADYRESLLRELNLHTREDEESLSTFIYSSTYSSNYEFYQMQQTQT